MTITETEHDAIRKAAFEEAAKICDALADAIDPFNAAGTRGEIMRPAFKEAAAAIRSRSSSARRSTVAA